MVHEGPAEIDSLRVARTVLLLAHTLEGEIRHTSSDDLTVTDLSVLRRIHVGCDLPSSVARALRIDPARVTRLVDRLVELGYVIREGDLQDRRRWRLHLTARGEDRLAAGKEQVRHVMASLLGSLSDEERVGLTAGLQAVQRFLEEDRTVTGTPAAAG
jgi:DNA-binding MarR family transcriptional regulator